MFAGECKTPSEAIYPSRRAMPPNWIRITIIPEHIRHPQFLDLELSWWPDDFEQEVFGILAQLERDLSNKGLYGKAWVGC